MVIEFAPGCGTAQSEDVLKLYVPSNSKELQDCPHPDDEEIDSCVAPVSYWRVMRKLQGGSMWPHNSVVLPGMYETWNYQIFCLILSSYA